jgi:hypothetical protein
MPVAVARRGAACEPFAPHHADGSLDTGALLSPMGRQFVAGVLAHAAALTALAAPTVNLQAAHGG